MNTPETHPTPTRSPRSTSREARRGAAPEVALGGRNYSSSLSTVPPQNRSARSKLQPGPETSNPLDLLRAALLRLPAADRAALAASLRPARCAIRPDYRTRPTISVDEAADLLGLSRGTIQNAIYSGRVQRTGSGRYCIDQTSLLRAFRRAGK